MKAWAIARRLLRQNRWLWLLLVLWPWAMAAFLLVPGGGLQQGDVAALLDQECFYGVALVAFTGGTLLGNEQRSRRIALVLARAVGRGEYLGALWLTAWLPQLMFAVSFILSGLLLTAERHELLRLAGAQLALGLPLASLTILLSILLPGIIASSLSFGAVALLYALPAGVAWLGMASLPRLFVGDTSIAGRVYWAGVGECLVLAGVGIGAAVALFRRRDLRLKEE